MEAKQIREKFLQYFKQQGHEVVSSAPMVVKNDPTLMFTNAGMNQFKDYFLGNATAENKRVTNSQKCLRVSGKHNDLEEVGLDTYHHTMFEMLGNWSFGDYFKEDSIAWAWDLLTNVYGLPKDRLYVTVFGGDKEDGLEVDSEAVELWKKWVPEDRILRCSKKDNFWEMGETGPCGPCSEIHIDMRTDDQRSLVDGKTLVNEDDPLVIEIWNLVFIQFNRMANRSLQELPDKHIDTGMGFERLCLAIQGKQSNYDTDVFAPLIELITKKSGHIYGKDEKTDIAVRVIVDHIRAIAFAIADGQLPSNTGAGYVIRRILRRGVRYGYTFLGFTEPFMNELVSVLAEQFDGVFPELKAQSDFVRRVVEEEEAGFLRTLSTGIKKLDQLIASNVKRLEGEVVFELYDTYGFPYDLTSLIARENGIDVDEDGFKACLKEQKDRSRKDSSSVSGDWITVQEGEENEFIGYDELTSTSRLMKYRQVEDKKGVMYQLVLDKTPFYPEGGGQVGDRGVMFQGDQKIGVLDTRKENGLVISITKDLPADLTASIDCNVSEDKRTGTIANHTSTHLLQSALRSVLGDHVAQKGSLVNENLLRFDFSHFAKVTTEEIQQVEDIVNHKIRENILLEEKRSIPMQEAIDAGATALFGEKYGDEVRMITFDPDYSRELCGGCHVQATGEIGLFKITTEGSVAAGVRRIEAITGEKAVNFVSDKLKVVDDLNELLKNPKDLVKSIESLVDEKAALAKRIEKFELQQTAILKTKLESQIQQVDGVSLLIERISAGSADSIKQIAFDLKKKVDNLVLVLAADVQGKPLITAMIADNLVSEKDYNAGAMVRELAKEIKGGGGGQPFFATAGGKDLSGLDAVVTKAKEMILN